VSAAGRRPGNADTRGEILDAARRVFATRGYDGASLRAIAREASVDPALVHHYFDGKASLFVAAMSLPFDPRDVSHGASSPGAKGAQVVRGFLTMWDRAEGTGSSFASCASAMAASRNVADAVREFVSERVWSGDPAVAGEPGQVTERRRALVASQLMGLAFTRYILRVPPLSTAAPERIGHWAGPTLDRYFSGPLDDLTLDDPSAS
jgi:AcrR family transcriptional regulator